MKTSFKSCIFCAAMLSMLFAACSPANNGEPEKKPEPTFEDKFCHKWECWKTTMAGTDIPIDEGTTYVTFLEDGKMLFESNEEVKIYKWSKVSDTQVVAIVPLRTEDLNEAIGMLSKLGLGEDSFRDTITLNADITELSDTSLVLESLVSIEDMFTESTYKMLTLLPAFENLLNFSPKYILYFRKEADK